MDPAEMRRAIVEWGHALPRHDHHLLAVERGMAAMTWSLCKLTQQVSHLVTIQFNSMVPKGTLLWGYEARRVDALVDSGADNSFIDTETAKQTGLPLVVLNSPDG